MAKPTNLNFCFGVDTPADPHRSMRTPSPDRSSMNAYLINGTVLTYQTYVKVRWGWITILAVEQIMACVFVIITIVHTQRRSVDVLKRSVLASLVVLDESVRAVMGGKATNVEDLEKKAAGVNVRFKDGRIIRV